MLEVTVTDLVGCIEKRVDISPSFKLRNYFIMRVTVGTGLTAVFRILPTKNKA